MKLTYKTILWSASPLKYLYHDCKLPLSTAKKLAHNDEILDGELSGLNRLLEEYKREGKDTRKLLNSVCPNELDLILLPDAAFNGVHITPAYVSRISFMLEERQ